MNLINILRYFLAVIAFCFAVGDGRYNYNCKKSAKTEQTAQALLLHCTGTPLVTAVYWPLCILAHLTEIILDGLDSSAVTKVIINSLLLHFFKDEHS